SAVQPDPGLRLAGLARYAEDQQQLEALRKHVAAERDYFKARVESSFLLRDQLRMQEEAQKTAMPSIPLRNVRAEVRARLESEPPVRKAADVMQWIMLLAGPVMW